MSIPHGLIAEILIAVGLLNLWLYFFVTFQKNQRTVGHKMAPPTFPNKLSLDVELKALVVEEWEIEANALKVSFRTTNVANNAFE